MPAAKAGAGGRPRLADLDAEATLLGGGVGLVKNLTNLSALRAEHVSARR